MSTEQATGTITGLLGNIVDDTMHFVDDLLARVHDVEIDARGAVSGVVSDLVDVEGGESGKGHESGDNAHLQESLTQLQAKMDELNRMRGGTSA